MPEAPDRELLKRCVSCGMCLSTCPTFAELGLEADSPRGRIQLMKQVAQGDIAATDPLYARHIDGCLGCRACESACPSGVEYGKLLEGARAQLEVARPPSPRRRALRALAFAWLLPRPAVLAAIARLGVTARDIGAGGALRAAGHRVPLAKRLGELLDLLPARVSSAAPPRSLPARGPRRGAVALFTGCVMRAAFADTNLATARVLARNGIDVEIPRRQTCCGALPAHAGDADTARKLARENLAALGDLEADAIVVNAAGCGAAMKEYGWLLRDDPEWSARAARFSARVRDASEYLGAVGLVATPGPLPLRVTYDDPCHLLHGQRVAAQPRALLRSIPGIDLLPLPEADWCCGSAGTYNLTQPAMSRRLLDRKVGHVLGTGASVVVTANPGCQMQIAAGLRAADASVEVVHLMDVLDRAYGAEDIPPVS